MRDGHAVRGLRDAEVAVVRVAAQPGVEIGLSEVTEGEGVLRPRLRSCRLRSGRLRTRLRNWLARARACSARAWFRLRPCSHNLLLTSSGNAASLPASLRSSRAAAPPTRSRSA